MIVHPARPVRSLVDIDDCEQVLNRLMGNHLTERHELLASGVPAHTVNSLYPLDLDAFIEAVSSELTEHGMGHLRADVVWSEQWYANYDRVRKIGATLSDEARASYEKTWHDRTMQSGVVWELMMQVYSGLLGWHPEAQSDGFSGYYARILLALHWLAANPEEAKAVRSERRALQEWVVNALLPGETAWESEGGGHGKSA